MNKEHLRPERNQYTHLPPAIKPSRDSCKVCRSIICSERIQKGTEDCRNHNDEGKSKQWRDLGRSNDSVPLLYNSNGFLHDLICSRELKVQRVSKQLEKVASCLVGSGLLCTHDVFVDARFCGDVEEIVHRTTWIKGRSKFELPHTDLKKFWF